MLTEEAYHMFVGEAGVGRIVRRSAQLMKESRNGDARELGGVPLDVIQKYINFWYSYSLDLFGGEISSNSADFFAAGLKGRYRERELFEDHVAADGVLKIEVIENDQVKSREAPLRNALNEVLRGEYAKDCERGLARWNKILADEGVSERLCLPSRRFHRRVGEYAKHCFDINGALIPRGEFERRASEWLPTARDREYVLSLMTPVTRPRKIANWIAPPAAGTNHRPFDFEYVRL
jgi:benzoyl-CoA 2,3-dioxygenase component B